MKSWIWSYLWTVLVLLTNVSADPSSSPRYAVHQTPVSFDKAMTNCSPDGVLTTLATEQEVAEILGVISESFPPQTRNKLEFWVGLRKVKKECVVPTLPLRGFKWIEDGSEDTQVIRWNKEPEHTCTTVFCAVLQVELDGETVTSWGLIPDTCRHARQFICKLTGGTLKPPKPATPAAPEPEPATTEPEPTTTKPEPTTTKPEPATTTPHRPESQPASQKPEPTGTEPPTQPPETELQPDLGSKAAPESGSCLLPTDLANERSIILDHNNRSRIQVECWTGDPVELHCSGHPTVWRLLDNSPANFTSICQRCDDGFKRDASGNCVDVDECGGGEARCRDTCLNTEGSFRCVCTDQDGKHQDEDSPACTDTSKHSDEGALSGVLLWVLIGVGALLLLLLLVAVTVKCCLMRRSKKRAMKKAEKMAMKSKDDKDSVNEKVAI